MPRVGGSRSKAFRSAARKEDPELRATLERLGKRIAELRHEASLTQEALASAAGVGPRHLQDVEYGRSNVTFATLVAIARALDLSVAELTRGVCRASANSRGPGP